MFIAEWLDGLCIEPYRFKVTERFYVSEVRLDIDFDCAEDAFLVKIKGFSEQLPKFTSI